MSFGNPRQPSTFSVGGMADADLQNQLALYKPVATVRDMKQVYFYAGVQAGICWVHPLRFMTPIDNYTGIQWEWGDINLPYVPPVFPIIGQNPFPKYVGNPWYLPIGTTRSLDISNVVNDLLDIRVPKDKYVLEINLVECNIESDPGNWLTIPDYAFFQPSSATAIINPLETRVLFKRRLDYSPPNSGGVATLSSNIVEATKVSTPETLFVRIKELCNNEPYNWTVTNTGQYTLDKSQQLLVRHGDINYSMLTLEFGHLVFTGRDEDQEREESQLTPYIRNSTGFHRPGLDPPNVLGDTQLPINRRKENFKYIDYNSEVFNAVGVSTSVNQFGYDLANIDSYYINEYKTGYYEQPPPARSRVMTVQPANRPPFIQSPVNTLGGMSVEASGGDPPVEAQTILAQCMPLKSNQQAKSITFRFMVRIIHMF